MVGIFWCLCIGASLLFTPAPLLADLMNRGEATTKSAGMWRWLLSDDPRGGVLLWQIRGPRTLLAMFSGGSLAAAGVLSQGVFRNPLASPSLVGTQAGAVLLAVLAFAGFHGTSLQGLLITSRLGVAAVPISAIIGCWLTHSVVSACLRSGRWGGTKELILLGLALHIVLGGVTAWVLSSTFYRGDLSIQIIRWMMGSYAYGSGWEVVLIMVTFVAGGVLSLGLLRSLDVYALGEDLSRSLSVSTDQLRSRALAAVSLWVGGSVATSGGVPFVGLVAPHIARYFIGPRHGPVAALSVLIGSALTMAADVIARSCRYPEEMEVGIILTLFGGGFFLFLLLLPQR